MINNNFWKQLTKYFNLGILQNVTPIAGGVIHKIFHVTTSEADFAVKLLDSWFVATHSIQRWEKTEQFAYDLLQQNIPACVALKIKNKYVQQLNNQFVLIYPWQSGLVLLADEIKTHQAKRIGNIVANLHLANAKIKPNLHFNKTNHFGFAEEHWRSLIVKLKNKNLIELADLLTSHLSFILEINELAKKSAALQSDMLSHRDLQPRNVIWQNDDLPKIIDWEYAGWINAGLDLLLTALDWSYVTSGKINFEIYQAVFAGYAEKKPLPFINELTIYGYYNYCLAWLEISIRRGIAESYQAEFVKKEISGVMQALTVVAESIQVLGLRIED